MMKTAEQWQREIERLGRRCDLATGTAAAFMYHAQVAHPECGCRGKLDEHIDKAVHLADVIEAATELMEAICEDDAVYNGLPLPVRSKLEQLAQRLGK